jgi:hypothetical protein|eukprot:COSAG02_NODE_8819_length_2432_cov_314.948564_2_plen_58_part_00
MMSISTWNSVSIFSLRRISNNLFARVCVIIEVALHYCATVESFGALGGIGSAGEDTY